MRWYKLYLTGVLAQSSFNCAICISLFIEMCNGIAQIHIHKWPIWCFVATCCNSDYVICAKTGVCAVVRTRCFFHSYLLLFISYHSCSCR